MSDTPRTDGKAFREVQYREGNRIDPQFCNEVVDASFARELERELVVRTTAIANLHSLIDEMKKENAALRADAERYRWREAADRIEELEMLLNASKVAEKACADCDPHIGERVRELERDNAALLAANKDCLAHFDSLKADYDALRRHADNMALAIECAEGFEARDLDFAFDYRQWSKGK